VGTEYAAVRGQTTVFCTVSESAPCSLARPPGDSDPSFIQIGLRIEEASVAALFYSNTGFTSSDPSAFSSLCHVGNGIGAFAAHRRSARLAHRTVSVAGRVKPDPAKSQFEDRSKLGRRHESNRRDSGVHDFLQPSAAILPPGGMVSLI
jgi:hypothetical protein